MKINQTNNTRTNQTPEEPCVYCGSQSDFYILQIKEPYKKWLFFLLFEKHVPFV